VSKELLVIILALVLLPLAVAGVLDVPSEPPQEDLGGPLGISPAQPFTTYRVRPGDTLAGLSRRYGIPIEYIQASNYIADPKELRAGSVILLPRGGVVHVVKEGQTLSDIAAAYGVSEFDIIAANDLAGLPLPGDKLLTTPCFHPLAGGIEARLAPRFPLYLAPTGSAHLPLRPPDTSHLRHPRFPYRD